MLSVDEARGQVLDAFAPLDRVTLPLSDVLGLVLADDAVAAIDVPPFANSAMDGFAVRSADTLAAGPAAPAQLRVIGEAPAIQRMLGYRDPSIPEVRSRLLDRIENRGGRRNFVREKTWLTCDGYVSEGAGGQGSAIMTALVNGNSLVIIPEDCPLAEPGTTVDAQMLDWMVNEQEHAPRLAGVS
jgi:molybdopterin biosynthesis enzyme